MKLKESLLFILFILFVSCENKETSPISILGEGGVYYIEGEACEIVLNEFVANESWYTYVKYQEGAGWIDLSETEGGSGEFVIKALVKSNDSSTTRVATIVVRSGMNKIEYRIEQGGMQEPPEKPGEPSDPEKPIEPDTINPGEIPGENIYAFVSEISISNYNELFQLIGKKSYKFTYSDGKIVSVVEESEKGKKFVGVEYFKDKLVISDGIFKESEISSDGYLQKIESAPISYSNGGIGVGDWVISFSEYGVESVAKLNEKVSVIYRDNANYINDCNIDLATLVCVSLLRDISTSDFVYSQKALYNIKIRNNSYFQKATKGENVYLYMFEPNKGRVDRIDEYFQPKYFNNWLRRSIEIIYK